MQIILESGVPPSSTIAVGRKKNCDLLNHIIYRTEEVPGSGNHFRIHGYTENSSNLFFNQLKE
jgi:hypothetical protein